jgi:hypothetical protein
LLGVLLGGEGLGRAEHHMARVVYDDVDAAAFGDDFVDGRVGRTLGPRILRCFCSDQWYCSND